MRPGCAGVDSWARRTGKSWWSSVPHASERPRRVTVDPDGPLLVEGPVEVVADDGTVSVSHRFTVAICICRRSRTYPWCDTSHRGRTKSQKTADAGAKGPLSRGTSGTTRPPADSRGRERSDHES
ncbi:CDGSH iron-sulfur domain-containing protein [Streptomyces sp. NPDC005480]|uniref:CDGSH iron-sulfur domain-containing protein n=1 Tax=Streptomyces sp. NPDC005480 TaxID=3154880 RepID=UPI0033B1CFE6